MKRKLAKIKKLCDEKNLKISIAESCTGGLLSSLITELPGCSSFFETSLVTYSNKSKMDFLGVKKNTISQYGAVSHQTAKAMVIGLISKTKTDIAVSITGVAGPSGGTKKNPIGTVYFGIAIKNKNKAKIYKKCFTKKNRKSIQSNSVKFAIDLIYKSIT